MINLSININKIATLRNSRGGNRPSPVEFAKKVIQFGAQGVTIHPRPDERHITLADVYSIRKVTSNVEFNIEGYPDDRYLKIIEETRPDQATLVPDPPGALTSDAGWMVIKNEAMLLGIVEKIQKFGVRVSLFMETKNKEISAAKKIGANRIEFYTGPFAKEFSNGNGEASFQEYNNAAKHAHSLGLEINAGHDLDLENLMIFKKLTALKEVSIGHALICDALEYGFEETVSKYLEVLL